MLGRTAAAIEESEEMGEKGFFDHRFWKRMTRRLRRRELKSSDEADARDGLGEYEAKRSESRE